jgi:thiol-disulfide isomerase/thioredoxin
MGVVSVGDKPTIEFTAANGGQQISLNNYKGHIIVVDFWATWCGPCMAEADHMVRVNKTYSPKGLQFIGISLDKTVDPLLKVAAEKGFTWPQKFDEGGQTAGVFGVNSIPRVFVIGPEGDVLWTGMPSGLDAALIDAFKNHPPRFVEASVLAQAKATADKVEAALKEGGATATIKEFATIPASAKIDTDFAARMETIAKQIEDFAAKSMADIDPLIENKQYIEAAGKLSELIRTLGALDAGAAAKKRLADLMANPEVKAQFESVQKNKAANEELAIARRLQTDGKNEQAYLKYKAVAATFAGTPAGDQAKEAVATYEKNPALVKQANDNIIAGKAKAIMGMAQNYANAGHIDMAKKKYQEVIKLFPDSESAKQAKAAIDELDRNHPN